MALADDFDEGEFAGEVWAFAGEVGDAVDRDEAVELGFDLVDHQFGAGGDDGDAAFAAVVFDRGDGEAVDIVAAAGEQADDAGEDAGFVFDEHGDGSRAEGLFDDGVHGL